MYVYVIVLAAPYTYSHKSILVMLYARYSIVHVYTCSQHSSACTATVTSTVVVH